jgi:hypothetical protein
MKKVFLSILFAVVLFGVVYPAQAQDEQSSYREQLKKAIIGYPMGHSGVFLFLGSGTNLNTLGPEFYPIIGLNDPNAVPFLLNVLQNGPDWSEEELSRASPSIGANTYRYVARCYAALCLGYIGDPRALEPLLEILNNKDIETYPHHPLRPQSDVYNLRAYTAFALGYLGDRRAVDPLIRSLREDGFVECIYALIRLQTITATPVIVQVASEHNMFRRNVAISHCLEYMLKVKFTSRTAERDRRYQTIDQFPELGLVYIRDYYGTLWQHWLKAGDKYAREQFEKYYPQLKAALKDRPNARSLHIVLKERMLKGGVAVVPHLIAEIEKGDTSLIPVVAKLTDPGIPRIRSFYPQLSETATRDKVLEWWRRNKRKWTVFQPEITEK